MKRPTLLLLVSIIFSSTAFGQTQPESIEGAGPAYFSIIVDPDFISIVIESPMANYGVMTDITPPPENHGVPTFQDYNDLRARLSHSIEPTIEDIKPSIGSKFAFTQEAGCKYDEGSESIFLKNGNWKVTFTLDFTCLDKSKLKSVSINVFDLPGFSTGAGTMVNGDAEVPFDLDGNSRSVDLR